MRNRICEWLGTRLVIFGDWLVSLVEDGEGCSGIVTAVDALIIFLEGIPLFPKVYLLFFTRYIVTELMHDGRPSSSVAQESR